MAGFIGGRTSAFDYIQSATPDNPQNGEMWFDTDGASDGSGEVKIYDGANNAWEVTGFTSHADLTDVTRSAHHPPVDVSAPLVQPSDQSLGLSVGDGLTTASGALVAALGNGLGVDANGQVYVPASAVSQSMLAFDTATQGELDGHTGDTTNPHNVTDDQTGAASALSNHESDTTNPHNVTDDQTGAASALSNHAGNASAHHSRPTGTGATGGSGGSWHNTGLSGGAGSFDEYFGPFIADLVEVEVDGNPTYERTMDINVQTQPRGTQTQTLTTSGSGPWTFNFYTRGMQAERVYCTGGEAGYFSINSVRVWRPNPPRHTHSI